MIDRRARREESDGRDRKNRPASRFANQPMARGGARIFLVYGPIGQTIEEHGGRSRQNHADQDEKEEGRAGPAICRDEKRAQGKGQGEDRVRKTDQSEKASANILSGGFHPGISGSGAIAPAVVAPRKGLACRAQTASARTRSPIASATNGALPSGPNNTSRGAGRTRTVRS